MKKYNFPIEGMTCASCVARVEKIVKKFDNVNNVNVNLANETISFEADENVNLESIVNAVEEYGYKIIVNEKQDKISLIQSENTPVDHFYNELKKDFLIALILTFPVFTISMLMDFHFFHSIWKINEDYTHKILLILTTPIIFISGKRFYNSLFIAFRHFSFDMNSLVAIGTLTAFIYSVFATLFPNEISNEKLPHVYFETASVIITLILFGKILEHRSKRKANEAIKKLIELKPKSTRIFVNEEIKEIPISQIQMNDIVFLRPGDKVPADCIITNGNTTVDESMITGESNPINKTINDKIIGGTINLTGAIYAKVVAIGDNSVLGQIIKLVEQAQSSKPEIQKLVDKVASIFVPVVIIIGIITFISWVIFDGENGYINGLINSIAVLIVACPCALGLATPTAIIVSTGIAAQKGIIIKNGEALEIAQNISTIIFDKTGTLTEGKPSINKVISINENDNELLQLTASLEKYSEHPIAKAIVNYASGKNINLLNVESFTNLSGFGIIGNVDNKNILVGSLSLLKEFSTKIEHAKEQIENINDIPSTKIFIAVENELKGIILLEDKIKSSSKEIISELKKLKIKTVLLSGDNYFLTKKIADEINIDEFRAEILPNQKSDVVKAYQSKNEIVAMVGDGINDSPALAQADISFAIGNGTDIAIETAQITLLSDNLRSILTTILLSKYTIKIIKQNLFWAFFYNVILIPMAAFGKLNPMFAALAMSLSSVFVISNSLRLKTKKF